MARIFSSLKNYWADSDFFKRCFGKEYLVKAEGNSPTKHDFRKCPKCGTFISNLDPHFPEQKCKCKQILHREGKYEDEKGRIFILRRPFYGRSFGIALIAFILCFFSAIFIFRIVPVPDGYVKSSLDKATVIVTAATLMCIFVLFLALGFMGIVMNSIKWLSKEFSLAAALVIPVLLLFAFYFLGIYEIKGCSAVPFWTNVPIQEEVYDLQRAEIDQMLPTPERYAVAKRYSRNPQINLIEEFLLVAENDFPGLMKEYSIDGKALKRGSSEEARFYKAYLSYLSFLEAMDMHKFQNQCIADPWNMLTAGAGNAYPEIMAVCR